MRTGLHYFPFDNTVYVCVCVCVYVCDSVRESVRPNATGQLPPVRCPHLLINPVKSPLGQTPLRSIAPPSGQTPTPVSERDGVCYVN